LRVAVEGARVAGAKVDIVDLLDFPMPILNVDSISANGFDAEALKFQALLSNYHGLLIATPEYNGSVPGGLKNAIDWASRKSQRFAVNEVFKGKFAAMITASPGSFGGIRCLSHLRGILSIMGVTVCPSEIAVTFVAEKFDGDNDMINDGKTKALLEGLGASLADTLMKFHGNTRFVSDTSA